MGKKLSYGASEDSPDTCFGAPGSEVVEASDRDEVGTQLERARAKFDQLDADGNGVLSGDEL